VLLLTLLPGGLEENYSESPLVVSKNSTMSSVSSLNASSIWTGQSEEAQATEPGESMNKALVHTQKIC